MRLGSLFSGAGGLDCAVEQVFGAETVWHCEIDPAASKVLAHRWPGVPNYSDITATNWNIVEPVDILCGGWPCQPFSLAGKRKGVADERALWPHVARAIRLVRPRIIVLENVPAVLGPEFTRVADDLAALGYEFTWTCLRASDVGAPHRRERLFIVAHAGGSGRRAREYDLLPRESDTPWRGGRPVGLLPTTPAAARSGNNQSPSPGAAVRPSLDSITDLLPTPTVQQGRNNTSGRSNPDSQHHVGDTLNDIIFRGDLLPTPTSRDHKGPNQRGDDTCLEGALLPTHAASDATGGGRHPDARTGHTRQLIDYALLDNTPKWGKYAAAIHRWEQQTRPAPAPTEPNKNGNPRLNAAFAEWMMGWPAGWVTDIVGRNDALRIIGNGVVPQQAEAAIRWLLSVAEVAA